MLNRFLGVGVALAALWLVGGCGGGGNSVGTTGTVKLLVADAPLHLGDGTIVSEVNVTITRVELLAGDAEDAPATVLFTGSETINLLTLANKPLAELLQLALVSVPAGTYEQLRFIVDPSTSHVVVNGTPKPLVVASGAQTGLKIPLDFTIAAGATEVLLLDFDLTKLHQNHQFLLTPNAVRAVPMRDAGSVSGVAALAEGVVPPADMPVTITLRPQGVSESLATTQVTLTSAAASAPFVINGVPAGPYVVTASAPDAAGTFTVDIPVTVSAGQAADLGSVAIGTPVIPDEEPVPEP